MHMLITTSDIANDGQNKEEKRDQKNKKHHQRKEPPNSECRRLRLSGNLSDFAGEIQSSRTDLETRLC